MTLLALTLGHNVPPSLVNDVVIMEPVCAFEHRRPSFSILRPRRSIRANLFSTHPSKYQYQSDHSNKKTPNMTRMEVGGIDSQSYDENDNYVSHLCGVPASPCNRICRYNSAFYDGLVCIGCFREAYEIKNWNSMTNMQKSMTLLDAMDRCSDCSVGYSFDGAVTLEELNHQYVYWSTLDQKD